MTGALAIDKAKGQHSLRMLPGVCTEAGRGGGSRPQFGRCVALAPSGHSMARLGDNRRQALPLRYCCMHAILRRDNFLIGSAAQSA